MGAANRCAVGALQGTRDGEQQAATTKVREAATPAAGTCGDSRILISRALSREDFDSLK